jgi:DNA-binding MarR family transcriptional regulator
MKTPGSHEPDHVDRVREQWRLVRPDLDTTPLGIVARVGRLAAYFDQSTNALMASYGLTRSSWDVLASLRRSSEPFELTPTQLYRGLMRSSGAMTNMLKALEEEGLVKRSRDPRDGRGRLVRLSPDGLALVDEVAAHHLANEREMLASLTPSERIALESSLRTLLRPLETAQPEPPREGASQERARSGRPTWPQRPTHG